MKHILLASVLAAALVPAAASAQSFDGAHVGVQAGIKHDTAINSDQDSFIGGVYAGYDREVSPNIVLGAEAGFSLAASDRIGPAGTNAATVDPLHSFDVSARAGYVLGGKNLLYVRGGYENTRARLTSTVGNLVDSDKRTYDGWFVGGGIERQLIDHVSTRLEYRFSDLGSDGRDYNRHQLLLGVAYKF